MKKMQFALRHKKNPAAAVDNACQSRRGTAVVEFALTFPIVLGFFLAMIFTVQLFLLESSSEIAAYEGARRGIIVGSTVDEIETDVARSMNRFASEYSVNIERTNEFVEVEVVVPMNGNSWATGQWCPKGIEFSNTVRLQRQVGADDS